MPDRKFPPEKGGGYSTAHLATQEWFFRVLLFRRALSVNSVDTKISSSTLGAFAERLEDKVSQSEVLDLFEAALAALDHRKHFRCRVGA